LKFFSRSLLAAGM